MNYIELVGQTKEMDKNLKRSNRTIELLLDCLENISHSFSKNKYHSIENFHDDLLKEIKQTKEIVFKLYEN